MRILKTSELIARELASYIVDQELPEGTALPPEREMIESFGIGRNTLREALRILETRGVITIRSGPGGGPVVRRPRPSDLGEALTLILQFERATFREIMAARAWLEPIVTTSAARHITKPVLASLREIDAAILEAADDVETFSSQNRRFHSLIAANCGNVVLRIFAETLISVGDGRSIGISYPKAQILAIGHSHERILDALEAKDPEAAEAAMRAHLDEANTYWRRKYGELISRPVRWIP
ncbi:MAG TPA: FadR/GntR family transcriptional regulator [Nitrolancea sp.]|nr:FadR/GntR family transcriptional regulator [Nitrolancea sp.]